MALELGLIGWLDGISAAGVLVINLIIGIFSFYKSRKLKAKLLTVTALTIFFIGLLWLGPTTDFIKILITGTNIESVWFYPVTEPVIYPILSYMWAAPGIFFGMYIGGELLMPRKKWYLLTIYLIITIIYEFFLFYNPLGSFEYNVPVPLGSDIIDTSSNFSYPTAYFLIVFIFSIILFNGIGFLSKSFKATGVLKKKFLALAFGFILFAVIVTLDALIRPGVFLSVVRFGIIVSSILLYIGIRT
ncbi:MAG: hypothetical protein ACFFD5_01285 [Candidatus Thorarchaeota archaeon]